MIAIVDYGVGNLFSLSASLAHLGLDSTVTADPEKIRSADQIILPGVGAFGDAMDKLNSTGLVPLLKEQAQQKPLLGICLGMQLLFEQSSEYGTHQGLGLIPGKVEPLLPQVEPLGLKVPHMGWNQLQIQRPDPFLKYFRNGEYVYYVHSFYATGCPDYLLAQSPYGVQVPGLVKNGKVYGAQFHPEKSGDAGLRLLRAFGELV